MAPFITRSPPVAFRFTPFIPSPLCRHRRVSDNLHQAGHS